MKKLISLMLIGIILTSILIVFAVCSNKNSELKEDKGNITELESLGNIDVDENIFDVKLTIPAEFLENKTQEELDTVAKEEGYKEITLNEDGTATYVMTKSQHKKLLKEMSDTINTALQDIVESEDYQAITDIKTNDNFTDFTITTTHEKLDLSESMIILSLYMYGGMYSIFEGKEVDNIHISYVNAETGDIISESNSKDLNNKE